MDFSRLTVTEGHIARMSCHFLNSAYRLFIGGFMWMSELEIGQAYTERVKPSAGKTIVVGIWLVFAATLLPTPVHAQTLTMPTGWTATDEPSGPFAEHSKLMRAN